VSNRWFAIVYASHAVTFGWFWQIADSLDLAVAPLGYAGLLAQVLWLMGRLERASKPAKPPSGDPPGGR
jgi:hypothetical protein